MIFYIIKRMMTALLALFVIATLTFVLMNLIPGDPFTNEKSIPEQVLKNLRAHYGLDQPLIIQYFKYMAGIITLDFGPSITSDTRTVNELILSGFPVSAVLGIQALVIAVVFGMTLGIIAAIKHNGWLDYLSMVIAILGLSVPSFVLSTVLINYFAIKLEWLPVATWGTWRHTVLPSLALAVGPLAYIARLTRSSILEVLTSDYVQTAIAKGVTGSRLIFRHILRNALIPVVTVLGPISAGILTGSFVIEQIFGIPGIGKYFVQSISDRDYPVILGTTIFYSAILILFILIIDLTYGFLDPRIKLARRR
ncbi:MAG: ABC transporter permease [Bacillota bacterium]|jgi:ABC-type dipeptide/oligopeptide/nickel transport system permease component|uniref:ABC transporter permease n=1 Tax=Fictibacillus TaxID=1329200 RepID=UPI0018CC7CFB|nr:MULTISPECIES: ABC transporter permease [unclassified Fictibacillus]MBH0157201.1 ABC transporter permease [Fictibacillus sp. 5RED26]MBH0159522.1 ABC transporter permease [Fictibacillus sp. 26RED30]MBH0163678.1 ABC transporter permease [Fictibacillus sp. 7GRE50]MBH0169695.1 ABC transporter permease [Fictibacillus sp. 18YEL24]MBH0174195.1 ABC transporter permease [Fictibacillus sp. 23RED33]